MKQKYSGNDKIKGRPIRINKHTLKMSDGKDYAEVMFISDIHFGSPQCDVKRFLAQIDYCLKHSIYIILLGDLLESGTKNSVGAGVYEQETPVQGQYEQMCAWLKPLADKGLILGSHMGNHEERIYKDSGFNVMKSMCNQLGIRYLGDACWSHFKVGQQTYVIYSMHGRTGSRFDGTALLALERISTSFFADLVAMGHSHKLVTSSVIIQRVVNGLVREFKKYLLITGSYLKYDQSYGQALGLPLSKLGSPKVKFHANKRDLFISW